MNDMDHDAGVRLPMNTTQGRTTFGFEDLWQRMYAKFERRFNLISALIDLGSKVIGEADSHRTEPVHDVVCALAHATIDGACESILLCGNGYGLGALKIVRGMYESQWITEYLRLHPEEISDYVEYRKVIRWQRMQWLRENKPDIVSALIPEGWVKGIEDEFNDVKKQFTVAKGKVRSQWSKKSIREMAECIGRGEQYEFGYSLTCSIHHGNPEGMEQHFNFINGQAILESPPSEVWVREALTAIHTNLWSLLGTVNKLFSLNFGGQLDSANQAYTEALQQ